MSELLILVHVEESFRRLFRPMFVQRLVRACNIYPSVVHFTSNYDTGGMIPELQRHVSREENWGWGHEPGMFDEEEDKWMTPSPSPHQWTWVPPFLRDLSPRSDRVVLGGGCEGECLLNMETCLEWLGIPYRKVPGYVYGV